MSREDPQLKLRLTSELKEWVVRSARDNKRSVNAEIVKRLEASFAKKHGLAVESLEAQQVSLHNLMELLEEFRGSLASMNQSLNEGKSLYGKKIVPPAKKKD